MEMELSTKHFEAVDSHLDEYALNSDDKIKVFHEYVQWGSFGQFDHPMAAFCRADALD
jgi:hypothetical protein